MKKEIALFMAALVLGFSGPAMAAMGNEERVHFRLNYWVSNFTGHLEIGDIDVNYQDVADAEIESTRLDLEDQIGIDNPQNILGFDVYLRWSQRFRSEYGFYYVPLGGGKQNLIEDEYVLGYKIPEDNKLETDLSFYDLYAKNSLVLFDREKFVLDIYSQVDFYVWSFSFQGTAETMEGDTVVTEELDESESLTVPLVTFGLGVQYTFPYDITAYGTIGGTGFSLSNPVEDVEKVSLSLLDLKLGVDWRYRWFLAGLCYRHINNRFSLKPEVTVEEDGVEVAVPEVNYDFTNSGVMLSVGAVF